MAVETDLEFVETGRRVLELEIQELRRFSEELGQNFANAVSVIRDACLSQNKVVVCGVGKCSHIGDKIAATLTSTGTPAIALNSLNALHGDLGIVRDGDVVIALSYSGETEEMVNLLSALRRFNIKIVAITGNNQSLLAKYSDLVIDVRVEREACPLQLAPTSSTTVMLALGDALAMVLLEASGFREEDFAKFHPGGSLGRRLLTRASDMMRQLEQIAVVSLGVTVDDALEEMTVHRTGAVVVTEESSGRLAGIFTHGDFVRAFRKQGGKISGLLVDELMTPDPVTTRTDRLAVEVLGLLKQHRIDELVVLDDKDRPAGLIDVQDLARLGIL
ncbi:MAG: arabinose-5-phosphate isomerase [Verrucomicrobiales bacterium]|jgi:arabinose-5-phosphate isomerase